MQCKAKSVSLPSTSILQSPVCLLSFAHLLKAGLFTNHSKVLLVLYFGLTIESLPSSFSPRFSFLTSSMSCCNFQEQLPKKEKYEKLVSGLFGVVDCV